MEGIRLYTPEIIILLTLKRKGRLGARKLLEESGLHTNTLYVNLRKLLAVGLVVKRDSYYEITEKGIDLLMHIKRELNEVVN